MTKLHAKASAEKRLFISLLTRDIPLTAAFLDLIDNSINAALEPYSERLKSAADYIALMDDPSVTPKITISLTISPNTVLISDTAAGISAETAKDHVFKFGRADAEWHEQDRLSVYGIGLKRAIFKLGRQIKMKSDHVSGGFNMDLDVDAWAREKAEPWTFEITTRRAVVASKTGTSISVTELHDDVVRRMSDGLFVTQLREAISRTYAFFINKIVRIELNGLLVEPTDLNIGENNESREFDFDGVSCAIHAGIGRPESGGFRDRSSGWFIFCNGRAVVFADKSRLTGWGGGPLPIFQPKHRPFLGVVFFVSENAELLPWTTTKSNVNEDSNVWQLALRQMGAVGKVVISFLDSRYTDEGTDVASKDLQEAIRDPVNVLRIPPGQQSRFQAPKARSAPRTTRIQYDALVDEISKIANYLRKPSMSGSDIGRHTFNFFLRNEVGEK